MLCYMYRLVRANLTRGFPFLLAGNLHFYTSLSLSLVSSPTQSYCIRFVFGQTSLRGYSFNDVRLALTETRMVESARTAGGDDRTAGWAFVRQSLWIQPISLDDIIRSRASDSQWSSEHVEEGVRGKRLPQHTSCSRTHFPMYVSVLIQKCVSVRVQVRGRYGWIRKT